MDNLARLKMGTFNSMHQEELPDGTVQITMHKAGDPHIYRLHVRDLYGPKETVLDQSTEEVR